MDLLSHLVSICILSSLVWSHTDSFTWHLSLRRLKSINCDDKRCPAAKYREEYINWCNYICEGDEKFICQEDEEANVIEYCLPVNLTCEPGYYVKGRINPDDRTKVIVEKLQCRKGTYKQHANYCIDECIEQEDGYYLPDMLKLYENGSYKEAAKVICDYTKNYYTNTDQQWYYYDRNLTPPYTKYCVQIKENPCPLGERPLKDGTCVCVLDNMTTDCLLKKDMTVDDVSSTSSTSMSSSTEQPGLTSPTHGILHKSNEHINGIIAGLIVIVILIVILIFVIVYKCHGRETHIKQTNIGRDLIKQQTNIHYHGTEESNATELSVFNTDRNDNDLV